MKTQVLCLVEETPVIQVNHNNQLNFNIIDSYDRDSRERVMEFVKSVLAQSNNIVEETVDLIEVEECEVDDNE